MKNGPVAGILENLTEGFYRSLLDTLSDGVYFVDSARRIVYWNRGAEAITGYGRDEVLGAGCHDNLLRHVDASGRALCGQGCPLVAALADGQPCELEVFLHHRDGHRVPVVVRAAPIRDASGRVVGAVESFRDNSIQLQAIQRMEELRQVAFLDPLTGVGNRRFAEHVLWERLSELRRHEWPFGILFLDVDHLEPINNHHGHAVGDRALRTVAQTMMNSVRAHDFVGRWGGDEFIAIVTHTDRQGLDLVAERARRLIEESRIRTTGLPIGITVSVGVAMATPDDTETSLVQRADGLMHHSKLAGGNRATR